MINGTSSSGVTIATFNQLDTMNPSCPAGAPASACTVQLQDADFYNLAETVAHELGHYLGLNHPTEAQANRRPDGSYEPFIQDWIYDTPVCTLSQTVGGKRVLTPTACSQESIVYPPTGLSCAQACPGYLSGGSCPTRPECEYNQIMWVYTKRFVPGVGPSDGALFSPGSGSVLNFNPFFQ